MAITKYLILSIFIISCGAKYENNRTGANSELKQLKQEIIALQGTITQINNFVANDFTNCATNLPPFETKICQIAQTANAEQQVIFTSQLQNIAKIFQNEIYGEDCINTIDPGCPVAGSILAELEAIDVTTLENDLQQLEVSVLQLQADLASITSRLNDFDGSGLTVETVINNLEVDITSLEGRIEALEDVLATGDVYHTYLLCGDIEASGPVYEPILVTGDNTLINAYLDGGNSVGMGVLAESGVTGDQYLSTSANTKKCNFKIYDLTSSLKVCWNNSNRNASETSINTECDSNNGFVNLTNNCTCIN